MFESAIRCQGRYVLSRFLLHHRSSSSSVNSHSERLNFLVQNKGGSVDLHKDEETGLATVTLNYPEKKNAFSGKMMVDLSDIVQDLEKWSAGHGVLVHGANHTFCSGADLTFMKSMMDLSKGELMCRFMQDTLTRLFRLPLVSLALVEGKALGGGAEVACSCDFRAFTQNSGIGFIQARRGLSPGWGGGIRLIEILGRTKTLRVLASARLLTAAEAKEIGLADVLVSDGDAAVKEALEFLKTVTAASPAVTQAAKRVVLNASQDDFERKLDKECQIFKSLWGGPEHRQLIEADLKFTRPSKN